MSEVTSANTPRDIAIEAIGPVNQATSAADAVGRFWGHAVLMSKMDMGAGSNSSMQDLQAYKELMSSAAINEVAPNVVAFAKTLTEAIVEHPEWIVNAGVRTDYNPDALLGAVAAYCNIPNSMLPVKTSVWNKYYGPIDDSQVIWARLGYDGIDQQIWPPVPTEGQE